MKKRIFAIALALAMLLPVFAVGASAATLEEQGAALLQGTYSIFASGHFTLKGHDAQGPFAAVADGNRFVEELVVDWYADAGSFAGFFLKLLLGSKIRLVVTPDQVLVGFLERRLYGDLGFLGDFFEELRSLLQTPMIASPVPSDVAEETIDGKTYICVTAEDGEGAPVKLYYLNGQLKRVVDDNGTDVVDSLSPTADQSYFSMSGMLKWPFLIVKPLMKRILIDA